MPTIIEALPGLHTKSISDVKWNVDGDYLATTSKDFTTKVSALKQDGTLKLVHTVPSSLTPIKMAWHPSSQGVFAVAGDDKNVDIWDVRAPRATARIPSLGNNINMAWSPDGTSLAVGNSSDNLVVLDIAAGGFADNRMSFDYEINELAWSANSDHLLVATGGVGGQMGGINVISYKCGDAMTIGESGSESGLSLLHSLAGHNSNCYALAVDRRFRHCLVGGADFLASMWDLGDMVCKYTVMYDSQPKSVTFSGDGSCFCAAVDAAPTLAIYDTSTGLKQQDVDIQVRAKLAAWHPTKNVVAYTSEADPRDKSVKPKLLRLVAF
jgi:THO complex subunit 3